MANEDILEGLEEVEETTDELEEGAEDNVIQSEIQTAIQPCLDRIEAGEYATKDEAIDAMIADLEAARDQSMGGLGIDDNEMELPEAEEEEEMV